MNKALPLQIACTAALLTIAGTALYLDFGVYHALAWGWAVVAQSFYFREQNDHYKTINLLT